MERREDEVTRLGCGHSGRHRIPVAHLAYHTDVYVLAEHGDQRFIEARRVEPDFPLVDDGFLGIELILDGVFDRKDVLGPCLIHDLYHRSESRRLALTDRTDDEEESLRLPSECLEYRRQ